MGLFFRPAGNAYPAAQLLGRDDGGTGRTARSHHQGIGHRQATFFDSQDNAVYIRVVAVQLIGLFDHQIDGPAAAGFFRQHVCPGKGILLEGSRDIDAVVLLQKQPPGIFKALPVYQIIRIASVVGGGKKARTQGALYRMADERKLHFLFLRKKLS